MSLRRAALVGIAMVAPMVASAQRDTSIVARDTSGAGALACPASGTMLRAWASGGRDSAAAPAPFLTLGARAPTAPRDTTIRLAIADRSWTRNDVDAGVALGAGGTVAGRNAFAATGAPWHACAGASVHLGTVTASLHQVNGTIHLRADPGALDSIGRSHGSTPSAGSPRR